MIEIGICALYACAGCEEQRRPDDPDPDAEERSLAAGRELYARYCSLCHGENGEGYAADHANALNNQNFLKVATNEFLRDAIENGRPETPMSAWARRRGGPLSGGDVQKLVHLIRSWAEGPLEDVHRQEVTGLVARGRPLYEEHCQSCHGENGRSATALSLSNPRFLAAASDGYLRYSITHGRPPTPMPAFEGQLEPQAIDDLVVLIRSWARGINAPASDEVSPTVFHNLIINEDGAAPQFELREDRYVPAAQVADALEDGRRIIILDARATSDWIDGHIPGALPVPFYDSDPLIDRLPQDGTWIVAYCGCPHAASGRVVNKLRERGFPRTAVLDEGIHFWEEQGYPMARGNPAAEEAAEGDVPAIPDAPH